MSNSSKGPMIEFRGFVESPTFTVEEDIPEKLQRYFWKELPDQLSLLEVDCFDLPPAKCVVTEGRYRIHDRVHYSTKIAILFADCFWLLGVEQEEDEIVGEREGAAARRILEENGEKALSKEFDPYERRWDGLLALENDPLTRMRLLVA